jgi:hypothetical protein
MLEGHHGKSRSSFNHRTGFPLSMSMLPRRLGASSSGLGAPLPNGLFVDGIMEVDFETFSDIFNSILKPIWLFNSILNSIFILKLM